ncbi:MAG TPA: T9SS type A sorting domain-containing protein, partial [Bacteroidia bacterium]|nr:T9SS type A sorting domain-containing protein [Bacteroidia bacterium]
GKAGDQVLNDMIMDGSGDFYATGYTTGSNGNDIFTVKLSGTTFTEFTIFDGAGNSHDEAHCIGIDPSGFVYAAGFTEGGTTLASRDAIVIQYNSSGTQQWEKIYNSPVNWGDVIYSIKVSRCGHLYVTGSSEKSNTEADAVIARYKQPGHITTPAQLMMRDGYYDAGLEPNNNDDIYQSPDIWLRRFADGGTEHQNPDYSVTNQNKVYARIFNTGCSVSSSTGTELRLFWTRARTDEAWDDDWFYWDMTGSPSPNNWAYDKSDMITKRPLGAEITISNPNFLPSGSSPVSIPSIAPLSSYVISPVTWVAPNPDWYDENNGQMSGSGIYPVVCLLARLTATGDPINNEVNPGTIKKNVQNSNNVVTRNTYLTDNDNYYVYNPPLPPGYNTATVGVVNLKPIPRKVNIDVNNITPAGNPAFSNYGSLHVVMSNDLVSVWAVPQAGSGFSVVEPGRFNITADAGASFNGLMLAPYSLYNIGLQFNFNQNISVEFPLDYAFELRQLPGDSTDEDSSYSSTIYYIRVETNVISAFTAPTSTGEVPQGQQEFSLYPNPSNGHTTITYELTGEQEVSIEISDISGKIVKAVKTNETQQPGKYSIMFNAGDLAAGVYFCTLKYGSNQSVQKLVIQK